MYQGMMLRGGIDACPFPAEDGICLDWQGRELWIETHLKHLCLRNGHWKPETALKRARKAGIIGPVTITYDNIDYSGKGRSFCTKQIIGEEK